MNQELAAAIAEAIVGTDTAKKALKSDWEFLDLLKVNHTHTLKGVKVFLSVSGGRTSMYQAERLFSEGFHLVNDVVIMFANTSWEHPKTLAFVNNCFKRWEELYGVQCVWVEAVVHHGERKACTHKVVDYKTVSKNKEVFEDVVSKYGIPNVGFQYCTRELKENPINSYIRSMCKWKKGTYYTILGMRSDELQRVLGDVVVKFGKKYNLGDKTFMNELRFKVWAMRDNYLQTLPQIYKDNPYKIKEHFLKTMTRWVKSYLKANHYREYDHKDVYNFCVRTLAVEDKQNKTFPLVDWFLDQPDKLDILDWWEDQEFDLDLPEHLGNCIGCYKKSSKKLLKVIRDEPGLFTNTLEIDYGHVGKNKLKGKVVDAPRTMYRQEYTCQGMIALFKQTPVTYLRDHSEDEVENEGCASSCEAFGGDN